MLALLLQVALLTRWVNEVGTFKLIGIRDLQLLEELIEFTASSTFQVKQVLEYSKVGDYERKSWLLEPKTSWPLAVIVQTNKLMESLPNSLIKIRQAIFWKLSPQKQIILPKWQHSFSYTGYIININGIELNQAKTHYQPGRKQ